MSQKDRPSPEKELIFLLDNHVRTTKRNAPEIFGKTTPSPPPIRDEEKPDHSMFGDRFVELLHKALSTNG